VLQVFYRVPGPHGCNLTRHEAEQMALDCLAKQTSGQYKPNCWQNRHISPETTSLNEVFDGAIMRTETGYPKEADNEESSDGSGVLCVGLGV
jgi:hypothetical protein